jgi:hypothetical protein
MLKLTLLQNAKQSIWISPKRAVVVFLYSLLFFGLQVKALALTCLFLTAPFLPVAYIFGWLGMVVLPSAVGYALGAWLAVFLQAYVLASLFALVTHKIRRKVA